VIDWDKFKERVLAGTQVQIFADYSGMLLENYPYHCCDHEVDKVPEGDLMSLLRVEVFEASNQNGTSLWNPRHTRYFIDGQWKTFVEVMA